MYLHELPVSKHTKYLTAALGAAFLCPGFGGNKKNRFRLGSVIVYKKRILIAKHNCIKTHPKLLPYFKFPYLHSEANAILSLGVDNCEDCIMYVVRILRNSEIGMAKPCPSCFELIKHVNIKKVFYTTYDNIGELECK